MLRYVYKPYIFILISVLHKFCAKLHKKNDMNKFLMNNIPIICIFYRKCVLNVPLYYFNTIR